MSFNSAASFVRNTMSAVHWLRTSHHLIQHAGLSLVTLHQKEQTGPYRTPFLELPHMARIIGREATSLTLTLIHVFPRAAWLVHVHAAF